MIVRQIRHAGGTMTTDPRTEITTSFQTGTDNGPEGSQRTLRFLFRMGFNASVTLTTADEVRALAEWVRQSGDYLEDCAQQAHAWETGASFGHDPLFRSAAEEAAERAAWEGK
jgi:hypothetical protein